MKINSEKLFPVRSRIIILLICLMMFPLLSSTGVISSARGEDGKFDKYGGWKEIKSKGTGFFRVEQIEGKWWFITPEGHGFISKGVNSFGYPKGEVRKGLGMLEDFGLNTVGAWAKIPGQQDELRQAGIPYVILLDLLRSYAISEGYDIKDGLPDIYSEEFVRATQNRLDEMQEKFKGKKGLSFADDPYLIGWWPDNELRWASERNHILDNYMRLRPSDSGRKAAESFLREKFGSPVLPRSGRQLEQARDGFLEIAVRHYASMTTKAIRSYDKNHLILGSRLYFTPLAWKNTMPERMGGFEAVARGAKGYWDVISINCYFDETPLERVRKLHASFDGPILISEFNIGMTDKSQGKRGEEEWEARTRISAGGYQKQIPLLLAEPYVIGYHFFPFMNHREPQEHSMRPGLVNFKYQPREMLLKTFRRVNEKLELLHKGDIREIREE